MDRDAVVVGAGIIGMACSTCARECGLEASVAARETRIDGLRPVINVIDATRDYKIAAIPGDGIGTETVAAARRLLDTVAPYEGFTLFWREHPWGCDHYVATGTMMEPDGIAQLASSDAILLGAVGRPDVPDHVSRWFAHPNPTQL